MQLKIKAEIKEQNQIEVDKRLQEMRNKIEDRFQEFSRNLENENIHRGIIQRLRKIYDLKIELARWDSYKCTCVAPN